MIWNNASRTSGQIWIRLLIECAVGDVAVAPSSTAPVFVLEANISSRWRNDDVSYKTFDDLWDKCQSYLWIQWFIKMYNTCKYCVDSSICHFKFPKVVLVDILGKVGTLCTVLLSVYSGTCLSIIIESGSCLADTEQKKSWHVFSDMVYIKHNLFASNATEVAILYETVIFL